MRFVIAVCALLVTGPALAQDRAQTLADIRQELSVLFVEIQRLRGQLNTTGGASGSGATGGTIDRVNAIEAEVQRLTALTERIQLDLDGVVRDGTNRIGDLEFRLCELEADCDIATLGDTPSLGGVTPASGGAAPAPAPSGGEVASSTLPDTGGANLAVAEEEDFNRARTAFEAGDFADAAVMFEAFTNNYPGGPLSADAHYLRGEAEANQGRWSDAARAFLDSFSAAPDGQRAPIALTSLGVALAQIGQTDEACLTLAEVATRYPGSASVAEAEAERGRLGCQ
ncbi:tol-pal system protein YbgF [Gymnodinialimonas ulvae]|uniref:tol-pal system protein YbgF n=1 Tax=Gymnodinialimonas ulvae TaxID=3126504 RepID=UPI0030B43CFA